MPTSPSSRSPERPHRRRSRRVGAAAALAIVGVGSYAAADTWDRRPATASLVVPQDVPDDVRSELDLTWTRFLDRFEARHSCLDDVSVVLVRQIDGGDARYVAGERRIEIEIPTTPARFRESFAHELAHHVEASCPDFAELRAELHPLLGADQPWSGGDVWYDTPAERWAEHVAELVNGERVRHVAEIPADPRVTALITAWGHGDRASATAAYARLGVWRPRPVPPT